MNKKPNKNDLPEGYQELDFKTGEQKVGKIKFDQSVIDDAVFNLTNILLEQAKNKENFNRIRSGKYIKKHSPLCWTCEKSCGMCVCEKYKKGEC